MLGMAFLSLSISLGTLTATIDKVCRYGYMIKMVLIVNSYKNVVIQIIKYHVNIYIYLYCKNQIWIPSLEGRWT